MNTHCVSYEIALRLKAAGFPEPHKLMNSDVQVFVYNTTYQRPMLWPYLAGISKIKSDEIFGPTVSDILPLLHGYSITVGSYGQFRCGSAEEGSGSKSENIHDAAALAWLQLSQQNTDEQ